MTTLADLLATLRRLHLLETAQLDLLSRQGTGQNVDPRTVTKQLVEQGLLTHFQANQLFKGKGNELLLGSYVLLELLGEGGMGAVYKARNWKLGQVVALKLIRKERLANPAAVRRFQREIRASAQLNHANIVRALDADEVAGTHFLVMEYVPGGKDLHKLVREKGLLPIETVCRYIQQACLGLQHAFERGLVHRDIKPHNLIMANDQIQVGTGNDVAKWKFEIPGDDKKPASRPLTDHCQLATVKILDFGLARLEDNEESSTLTQEGSVMGTMDYLAPEQARDSHYADIRSDLYSLGCTMYFLLTGQAPFPGGTAAEKMYKHQFMEPTPLQVLRPETPTGVADIVDKLISKRPEDRYQAPVELALDLEAFLAGRPVSASATASARVRTAGGSDSSESLQETHNPFAGLSRSETAADEPAPMPIAAVKPPVAKSPPGNRKRLTLMAAGGAAALVLLVATVVVVFSRKPPPLVPEEPKIVAPKRPKQPTALELARAEEKERQEKEAAEKKKQAEEEAIRKQRAAEAEEPFKLLEAKFKEPGVTFASFAKEVAAFKGKHGGTPAAIRAAELLMKLSSPLDQLDPAKIPEDAKTAWKAAGFDGKDVVAVLGEHRRRHWGMVNCVAYSPDGKLIASGGNDNMIHVYDASTLQERIALKATTNRVWTVAFSPDSKVLASGSHEHFVRLWDTETWKELRRLEGHGNTVWSIAFSADGRQLVTGSEPLVGLWDVESGKELRKFEGHSSPVQCVGFSKDGSRALSTGSDKGDYTIRLWNVASGEKLRVLEGHSSRVTSATFLPDERHVLSCSWDGTARIWDTTTGIEVRRLTVENNYVLGAVVWPDGKRALFALNDSTLRLWNLESGRELRRFQGHASSVSSVALSPDGLRAVSGDQDGTVRLWDVDTGKEVQPLTGPVGPVRSVAFSPDCSRFLAGGDDGIARLWGSAAGSEVQTLKGHTQLVRSVAFSPDGNTLVSGSHDGMVKLWDPTAGSELRTLKGHTSWVGSVAFSPDGKALASGSNDTTIKIWDPAAGSELRTLKGHTAQVTSMAFSPDGDTLASGSEDETVKLWDPAAGRELRTLNTSYVYSVAFSPDGKMLASGHIGIVKLWDPVVGSELHSLTGHTRQVCSVAFSPDGKTLASAALDGTVRLWDPVSATAKHVFQIGPIGGQVHQVAFAADGRHLATANGNGTVYILRIPHDVLPPKALTAEQAKQRQADAAKAFDVPVTIENSIGMKLNLIPAGRFLMGSPEDEPGRQAKEGPRHEVTISKPFYLGTYEVSVGQFKAFVADTGYRTEAEKNGTALRLDREQNKVIQDPNSNWKSPGRKPADEEPVVCVSWDDAAAFCEWLSKKENNAHRLPTSAEWEYACRAGTQTAYFFGNDPEQLEKYAWFGHKARGEATRIGRLLPNPWGLHDILGNAWEWCHDGERAYSPAPHTDPRGPEGDAPRLVRGGSVHPPDTPVLFRSACSWRNPFPRSGAHYNVGFRVVCEIRVAAK